MTRVTVLVFFLVSFHGSFYALTCFFTHHIGFGCFVSLFPYYGFRTHLAQRFPQRITLALGTPMRHDDFEGDHFRGL